MFSLWHVIYDAVRITGHGDVIFPPLAILEALWVFDAKLIFGGPDFGHLVCGRLKCVGSRAYAVSGLCTTL